jgi:predicted acetyltransferase
VISQKNWSLVDIFGFDTTVQGDFEDSILNKSEMNNAVGWLKNVLCDRNTSKKSEDKVEDQYLWYVEEDGRKMMNFLNIKWNSLWNSQEIENLKVKIKLFTG